MRFSKSLLLLGALSNDLEAIALSAVLNKKRSRDSRFTLGNISNSECIEYFRFEKDDLVELCNLLRIPSKIICKNGTTVSNIEGFCIMLRRLVYPNRLCDLVKMFGKSTSELSLISNWVMDFVYDNHSHLLTSFGKWWLALEYLQRYSTSIQMRGCPLDNCWGFIDGTVRAICKPSRNQRECFNGHQHVHALTYQSVVTPNGIIANMYGPVEGRRHDSFILSTSGLLPALMEKMNSSSGRPFSLYGDSGYALHSHLIVPYRRTTNITTTQSAFNQLMSSMRIRVEWAFGNVVQLFAFCDFKKNQKLYLQSVAKHYLNSVLLTNCHTCLYGNETSKYFGVNPPSLKSYINNVRE